MFANIFRSQARLALTACRSQTSISAVSRIAARPFPVASTRFALRTISTSKPLSIFRDDSFNNNQQASNTLFIGNLPYSADEAELREKFEPYGPVKGIRIAYKPDGQARGFAHVEFVNIADAVSAVTSFTEEPLYILDRNIRIQFAEGRRNDRVREPNYTLYFSGWRGSEEALRAATNEYESSLVSVRFLTDRETGENTGAGFLQFSSVERATQALSALNGVSAGEENLFLRYADPPRDPRRRQNNDRSSPRSSAPRY